MSIKSTVIMIQTVTGKQPGTYLDVSDIESTLSIVASYYRSSTYTSFSSYARDVYAQWGLNHQSFLDSEKSYDALLETFEKSLPQDFKGPSHIFIPAGNDPGEEDEESYESSYDEEYDEDDSY